MHKWIKAIIIIIIYRNKHTVMEQSAILIWKNKTVSVYLKINIENVY